MGIVTPGFGLIFWTTLTFFLLLFLLAKFAWKPILKAVQDREGAIDSSPESGGSGEGGNGLIAVEQRATFKANPRRARADFERGPRIA